MERTERTERTERAERTERVDRTERTERRAPMSPKRRITFQRIMSRKDMGSTILGGHTVLKILSTSVISSCSIPMPFWFFGVN